MNKTSVDAITTSPLYKTSYQVKLSQFEGPLDLLLHLIERRQMEITAISLAEVTDQYIEYLQNWDDPPLADIAAFITMAAKLLYIKSRYLLPRQTAQDDNLDDSLEVAAEIQQYLLEYKLAKQVASLLQQRQESGWQSFSRLVGPQIDTSNAVPVKIVGLTPDALLKAYKRAIEGRALEIPEEVPLPLVRLSDKIALILSTLDKISSVELESILQNAQSGMEIVVTFLAVLELWRDGKIDVYQESSFGTILLSSLAS